MHHTLEFRAMGSQILAIVDSPARPGLLDQTPAWFETWEAHFSRFRPESELSQVNRQAGQPTWVSAAFAEMLEVAFQAHQLSQGLVTPLLLDALTRAGYDRSFDSLPRYQAADPAPAETILPFSLAAVEWNPSTRMLCLPPGAHLDFGGLAKGWAAHQAAIQLSSCGPGLVDAGGDIAISDFQSDNQPWTIGIADPFQVTEDLALLQLGPCGVATSGTDRRRWLRGDHRQHHIIDPRTGQPAQTDLLTCTIIAPTVLEAECAAKTSLILGSQAGLAWIETQPHLAGLLVLENGETLYSHTIQEMTWR